MKLSIIYYPKMKRPWLLKREYGKYEQHAHFYTRKEAVKCRILIDKRVYPRQKKYQIAVRRILTKEEYKKLNKTPRYCNKQKGIRRR
ncbi:hypothetical protein [uncultured Anaerococcus sp.]|uniref:hypothetical protein n=1 Tax=uncultured Anaerococcus sp. TaxID=293428 RepID=UPI0025EE2C43|nr:hypothetical protein [uncultured Anaerococcus sp.]